MADGISATDIGMLLFDVEPKDEIVRTEQPWRAARRRPKGRARSASRATGFFGMFAGAARWLWTRREGARARPGSGPPTASSGSGRWAGT